MAILAEEFYAVDVNVSLTLFGTMLGLFPVLVGGTPQQAERIFAPFTSGQGTPLAAFAFSEPGGSANFAAPGPAEGVRTQARLEKDHWVISGAKKWVSSGTGWEGKGADLLTVVCRTDLVQHLKAGFRLSPSKARRRASYGIGRLIPSATARICNRSSG
jgi:butyryl-CoA dehydrogenase